MLDTPLENDEVNNGNITSVFVIITKDLGYILPRSLIGFHIPATIKTIFQLPLLSLENPNRKSVGDLRCFLKI